MFLHPFRQAIYASVLSFFLFNILLADTALHQSIMDDYKVEKVADHTYVIHGPLEEPNKKNQGFMNNPSFIITDKSVIVVDPGGTSQIGRSVLAHIKNITKNPVTHVFNTHVHGDHWLGNQAFKEANPSVNIYAHPKMIELAKAGEAESWVELMEKSTDGASKGTIATIPEQALTDQQRITIDNITIRTHLSTWAHSKTDAMIEVVEDQLLFTGDNAIFGRIARMDDGNFEGNIKDLNTILALDLKHVVPGHGTTGDTSRIKGYRDYLAIIYKVAKEGYENDQTASELKPIAMKQLANNKTFGYQKWTGLEKQLGKHLSIALLEIEASDF